jgi:putative colanic acid biosynthesis glycosyltransferase
MSDCTHFFSIVTITRNDVSGLRITGSSIEEQTLRDFEWIVIDGASTDGTPQELQASQTPNLSFISEPDRGLYDAMNKGLARGRGRYVVFMNSGDCFSGPTVLEKIRQRILETSANPSIVYGHALEKTTEGRLLLKKARSIGWLNYGMHTHHQAILYSRESLENIRFDESFKISGDYDLTCRVYRNAHNFLALGFPVCIFSRGGLSEKKSEIARSENWRIQRDVLGQRWMQRALTRCAYIFSLILRVRVRSLYDRLRFEFVNGPN